MWEEILPPEYQQLPAALALVDAVLDDASFFAPYAAHFSPLFGRPSIPIDTYLRMMYLKHRYRLGYESLCREVADSISWTRFCRIPLGTRVPHPSTLEKITKRCGPETVQARHDALLARADAAKVLKTDQVRTDTTVVPANVAYPTDSGLLAKAIARIAVLAKRIQAAGAASRTKVRDRRRSARARAHAIAAHLRKRREEAAGAVLAVTGELAGIAEASVAEAAVLARNTRRYLNRCGQAAPARLAATLDELDTLLERTTRIVAQTRTRLAGASVVPASRLVSMHDIHARPIKKGRLSKPVEFGYKAEVADNRQGIVVDYAVHEGNPPDARLIAAGVGRIKARLGRVPTAMAADRGYGEADVGAAVEAEGVRTVVIPRKGKPSIVRRVHEHSRGFRRLVKWRTGSEGRVSQLKNRNGWDRSRFDGLAGASTWCGLGVLAHNAVRIAALIDARQQALTVRAAARAAATGAGNATNRSATDPTGARTRQATGPPPGPPLIPAPCNS